MDCKVAIVKLHDYLDGDMSREEIDTLQTHLSTCASCSTRLEQLEKTDASIYRFMESGHKSSREDAAASAQLKERIMAQLPKQGAKKKERSKLVQLLYRYPGATAAAVFLLIMFSSLFASWGEDSKLIVSGDGADLQQIVINGDTVIVPAGVQIAGDLTVENGKVEVQGSVDGDVTVIDGSMVLASTGHIAGQSRTIDQALDWFWYKVTNTFGKAISP
ncbi:zf-HC2 domain-containing protein [Paenibacillus sp. HB172176]|uniref:zf-HC2 domain-containing protein n=1 Tax=Paenibacillus sp. HB172176 TaxID=2493690 RepID=UPI001438E0C2|nr:zf-HC2 domain-containing protein [Paenibacillus sp. HB172176]